MHQHEDPADGYQSSVKCSHCNSMDIFHDKESGEDVCRGCGTVLSDTIIDPGKEWREFSQQETEDRSRVAVGKDAMNRSTWTTFRENEIKDQEKRYQFQRMKKEASRSATRGSKQRNLSTAKNVLDIMCSKLGYEGSHMVKDRAARIYVEAYDRQLVRGRNIEGIIAASIKLACRELKVSRPLSDIAEISQRPEKEIARDYRLLVKEMGAKLNAPDPRNRLATISGKLDAPQSYVILAERILAKAKDLKLLAGRGPAGLAAASLYMSSKFFDDDPYTQGEISAAGSVTEVTIRNRCKDIVNAFEKHGIGIRDLAEGVGHSAAPSRKRVPEKAKKRKPVEKVYLERLDKLSGALLMDGDVYNAARDIFQKATEGTTGARKKIELDASVALALEMYVKRVCPERLVSSASESSSYDIRKAANRIRAKLNLKEPDIDFSAYVDYLARELKLSGLQSKSVLRILREYERDRNGQVGSKMYLAAAATKRVMEYSGTATTMVKLCYTCGISSNNLYKGLKELGKYGAEHAMDSPLERMLIEDTDMIENAARR